MDRKEEMIADSRGTSNSSRQPTETDHKKSLTRSIQDGVTTSGVTDTLFNYPRKAFIILPLIFKYLNFFYLPNISFLLREFGEFVTEFINHEYICRKKIHLFRNFNLKEFLENINAEKNLFLMKYDKEFTLEKRKYINYKDFLFIMKSFGEFMKTIIIQTECLSDLNKNKIDHQTFLSEYVEVIKKYINKDQIDVIQIDDHIYNDELLVTHLPTIDLQNNSMNNETLDALIQLKGLLIQEIKLLTDYKELNINDLIKKYLMHLEIRDLTIAGPSLISIGKKNVNQCCDEILEAFVYKSKNSLQNLTIKTCQIYNFYGLLNKFNNLSEIIFDNIQHIGSNSLLMSGVKQHHWIKRLHIINCPTFLDDDLCYEFITNYFYNLTFFRIANCDNVAGEFLYKLKERERGNELLIVQTHMNKEIEPTEIDATKIPKGIKYTKSDYAPYSHKQIHKLISSLKEEFDYNNYDTIENMPQGFENVLEDFHRSGDGFHLDLSRFNRLNEKCLILIQRIISKIKKLSLNTYYTDIKIERLSNFLREICIRELHISGYEYVRPTDERSGCDQIINALSVKSSESLEKLEITDCSLGDLFFDRLDNFKLLWRVILRNVHFSATSTFNRIHLPKVKEIRITNCPELNDEMCSCLIENCPNLNLFVLSGCNCVTGSFLSNIDENRKISIHIEDAPGFFTIIKETPEAIPQISEKINLWLRTTENSDSCEIFNGNCNLVKSDNRDIIIDDKFFKNLLKFDHLYSLTMSTFYTNVNWANLCELGLKFLHLFNDKFYENDAAVDIISSFAKLNPKSLHILSLKRCKIDARGIESLKCFTNLSSLLFETMHGLTNELIAQLSVPKGRQCILGIINNDDLDDETCFEIIKERKIGLSSVAKCRKITENLIEKIQSIEGKFWIGLEISGTEAGYTELWNPRFLIKFFVNFKNFTYETHVDYLRRIFDEIHTKSISKLPEALIECFTSMKTLDLSDFHGLDDAMFELLSQLENLGTLKIRANYQKVMDPWAISRNLLKMKLHTLIVQGYGESSNCDNILESFSDNTNTLQEIHLINCHINTDLIRSVSNIRNLSVLKVFNQGNDYTKEIVNGFHLNHEITLRVLVVNGVLINLD